MYTMAGIDLTTHISHLPGGMAGGDLTLYTFYIFVTIEQYFLV
jgi:hypothetical protein